MNDYLRGLIEAEALCVAKPMAFAFSAAGEIRELIAAERKRLAPIERENARIRRAMAPRGSVQKED
jgi:hypothetical protein